MQCGKENVDLARVLRELRILGEERLETERAEANAALERARQAEQAELDRLRALANEEERCWRDAAEAARRRLEDAEAAARDEEERRARARQEAAASERAAVWAWTERRRAALEAEVEAAQRRGRRPYRLLVVALFVGALGLGRFAWEKEGAREAGLEQAERAERSLAAARREAERVRAERARVAERLATAQAAEGGR